MDVIKTNLPGLFVVKPKIFSDERGEFIKIFNEETFSETGLPFELKESYYSTSKKNVIRGMHFQTPPMAHTKLVYVTRGAIVDVVLDIRNGSSTYGQYAVLDLSEENRAIAYIPVGFAHGFMSLSDDTCVVYLQTTGYSPENDAGIHFESFGMDFGVEDPIVSMRDRAFPRLEDFESPFIYQE